MSEPLCDKEAELELVFKTSVKLLRSLQTIWSVNGPLTDMLGQVPDGWQEAITELPGLLKVIVETECPQIRFVGNPPSLGGHQRTTAHEMLLVFGEGTLNRTQPLRDALSDKSDDEKIREARKLVIELLTVFGEPLLDTVWEDLVSYLQREASETLRYHGQNKRDRERKEVESQSVGETQTDNGSSSLLEELLDLIESTNRQKILRFLVGKKHGVDWDSLPDDAFRSGSERSDSVVKKALERLQGELMEHYSAFAYELQIEPAKRRVRLLKD